MHLKFVNEVDRVADLYPIVKAKDVSYNWVKRLRQDFACEAAKPSFRKQQFVHAARCPGIFHLQRHGFIMRTWSDILIKTNGDGSSFEWRTPHAWDVPLIDWQHDHNFARHFEHWPDGSLRHVLKFNSGWRVKVPRGYFLLEMAVPYQDDKRFDVFPGYFSTEYGWAAMNPFFRWNVKDGEELIPAGTPIAQYILVPRDEISFDCENYDPVKHRETRVVDWFKQTKFVNDLGSLRRLFSD